MRKFLCDEMLADLGKWLRAAGYDTVIITGGLSDEEIIKKAKAEGRILLSRDCDMIGKGIRLSNDGLDQSAKELKEILDLDWLLAPFTRCMQCNTPLVRDNSKWHCPTCHQQFWLGSHTEQMLKRLKQWNKTLK